LSVEGFHASEIVYEVKLVALRLVGFVGFVLSAAETVPQANARIDKIMVSFFREKSSCIRIKKFDFQG
jgi:hypothetical protein